MTLQLWVRCGDGDDYNHYECLEDVAAALESDGVAGPLYRDQQYGVNAANFTHHNYISLFWGDSDAQPGRELTDAELRNLNSLLE